MVRKAWAGKVPASVGMALLIEIKKEKPGGREVSRLCVPDRRVGNCCCDTSPTTNNPSQRGNPTLHGGRKQPRKPSSSLQTVAITFAMWAWAPAISLAGRVHRTQACFSVGAGVEPMQRVLWDFAFGFSGPASTNHVLCVGCFPSNRSRLPPDCWVLTAVCPSCNATPR